ncbi:hypothetical protein HMPREF1039_0474 [Megasphaera lornae]|uniref:Uncharacterized protein n=1 Tax=Megasphaera lornae TaxID=1000568 RepID=A0ABN0D0R9_9FIRM|nr:hypothetical protein [Megasphaera lornae]EGL39305.1 hypothetical protein HMPREF1039_0474 [Megasphaera lornae]
MSTVHAEFAKLGKYKWVIYALVVIAQLSTVAYAAWRYHNIGVDGIPYQWRCVPRLETAAFGTDYIRIIFPEDTAKWLDNSMPETGKKYMYIFPVIRKVCYKLKALPPLGRLSEKII